MISIRLIPLKARIWTLSSSIQSMRSVSGRVYIVGGRDTHRVYLVEVDDLRSAHLRGLAWNVLQRGISAADRYGGLP